MSVVEYDKQGHIVTVTLNRPESLNALNRQMDQELADAWMEFDNDKDAYVAILTGRGRAFCAGLDLKEATQNRNAPADGATREPPYPQRNSFMHNRLDKPVIAAINGLAFGHGWFQVSKTDLRVAAESATFQISEVRRGMLGDYGIQMLHTIGSGLAAEMALGGTVTARRLYEVGFINTVTPDGETMPAALAWAEHILSMPPLAVQYTVKLMHRVRDRLRMRENLGYPSELFQDQAALIEEGMATLRDSEDRVEAARAFLEKRPPVYQAR